MKKMPFTFDLLQRVYYAASRVPMHLSPDGRLLAVTMQRAACHTKTEIEVGYFDYAVPLELDGSSVAIVNVDEGTHFEPFRGAVNWAGQWSPDGTCLAAYVQQGEQVCLGIWDQRTASASVLGDIAVKATFGWETPQWSEDSRSVLVKLQTVKERLTTQQDAPDDLKVGVWSFNPKLHDKAAERSPLGIDLDIGDLGLVELSTGTLRRLLHNRSFHGWRMSPDGRAVAVMVRAASDGERADYNYGVFEFIVIALHDGTQKVVAAQVSQPFGINFSWSPDSQYLAYTTDNAGELGRLFVVLADGSQQPVELTVGEVAASADVAQVHSTPRWSADSRSVYCLIGNIIWRFELQGGNPTKVVAGDASQDADLTVHCWIQRPLVPTLWSLDNQFLLAEVCNPKTKRESLAQVDLTNGNAAIITEFLYANIASTFAIEAVPGGADCYLWKQASDQWPAVWRVNCHSGKKQQVFAPNQALSNAALGTGRLIEWRSDDGTLCQGALMLPPNFKEGQRVPLIVHVYGGLMNSYEIRDFGLAGRGGTFDNAHLLASQGYAVLCPDMPMADRDPMQQVPGLVLPAVNHVIDLGIADPERLGVMGHSYGGFCVLALLVQTKRFHAAVCIAGIVDFTSVYGQGLDIDAWPVDWVEGQQARLGGSVWEQRNAYIENSPFFYLDRVTTPVLLVAGGADGGAPLQAKQAFTGLRRLGKEVELRLYPGCYHAPTDWPNAEQRDLCGSVLRWFETHFDKLDCLPPKE